MLLLAACVSTPAGGPREAEIPADRAGTRRARHTPRPRDEWWLALGDPQLDRLVGQALAGNPSLAASLARVRGAWEQARAMGAADEPRVDFDLSAFRSKVSGNYIYPPPYAGSTFWDGRVGFDLVWNLDFWGRQAALIDQARSSALAAELDAAAAALAVSGALSQTYVDLERVTALEKLADRAVRQREELLELTARRVKAGLDSDVELRTAESNRGAGRRRARAGARRQPSSRRTRSPRWPAAAPRTTRRSRRPRWTSRRRWRCRPALPADLLAHRPDVAAAKARIAAAQAGRTPRTRPSIRT